jgi:hypothetical protein
MLRLQKKYWRIVLLVVSLAIACIIFKKEINTIFYIHSSISIPTSLQSEQVIQRDFRSGEAIVSLHGRVGWLSDKVYINLVDINSKEVANGRWVLVDSNPTFTNYSARIPVSPGKFNLFLKSKRSTGYEEINNELIFGVGEVFIVAGQSNASGLSEKLNRSITNYVSTGNLNGNQLSWRNCSDPQQSNWGGSVWPIVGDSLYKLIKVPIGFINISALGSSIANWQKGTDNYENLIIVLKSLKPFGGCRAVLWQQGEADHGMNKETYKKLLSQLIMDCQKELGQSVTWVIAHSSYYKGIISYDMQEAQKELVNNKNVFLGPNIDSLNKDFRNDNIHLNPAGIEKAARMWTGKIYTSFYTK